MCSCYIMTNIFKDYMTSPIFAARNPNTQKRARRNEKRNYNNQVLSSTENFLRFFFTKYSNSSRDSGYNKLAKRLGTIHNNDMPVLTSNYDMAEVLVQKILYLSHFQYILLFHQSKLV